MFNIAVASVLLTLLLMMIALAGYRAVSGHHSVFYRIAVICLIVGLNFITTETVTGDVMSEFGTFMFFAGLFICAFLVVVDAYVWYGKRLAQRSLMRSVGKELTDGGLTD